MPSPTSSAFTLKSTGGLLKVLITDVNVHIPGSGTSSSIKAIWDTGASGSAITKDVAKKLGLVPTGKAQVHTANGMVTQNTFTIDIGLPNKVLIKDIIATEIDALSTGCHALIGMDVISLGDFSITNHNGLTCMSFRVPSGHEIDYVKNRNTGNPSIKTYGTGKPGNNFMPPKKKRRK